MGNKEKTSPAPRARVLRISKRAGPVLLACGKCQRKLKHEADEELGSLKKILKRRAVPVQMLKVPCLKICPKGGVTVSTQAQFAAGLCSILYTQDDLEEALAGPALADEKEPA